MRSTRILQVRPGIHCVFRPVYLACSYLAEVGDGVVLVDSGMDPLGRDMILGLRSLGRTPSDVRAILLTHWHNDHSNGAESMRQLSGAQAHYSSREAAHLTRPAANLLGRASAFIPDRGALGGLRGILGQSPTRPLGAGRHVRDGELVAGFRVIETPGHSPGHLSFFLESAGVLFAGDALAVCRGRISYMSRYLTPDLALARESMRRCLALDAVAICPGHRAPLVERVAEERRRVLADLDAGKPWPWLS